MADEVVWDPISEFAPGWFYFCGNVWTGEIDGEPAWSDGHIMCLGHPPRRSVIAGTKDFTGPLKRSKRDGVTEIFPVAVAEFDKPRLIFSDGHTVDIKFYNWVHAHWPSAHWFGDEASKVLAEAMPFPAILVYEAGKLVALVMAMRTPDWQEKIRNILASVNGPNGD